MECRLLFGVLSFPRVCDCCVLHFQPYFQNVNIYRRSQEQKEQHEFLLLFIVKIFLCHLLCLPFYFFIFPYSEHYDVCPQRCHGVLISIMTHCDVADTGERRESLDLIMSGRRS